MICFYSLLLGKSLSSALNANIGFKRQLGAITWNEGVNTNFDIFVGDNT